MKITEVVLDGKRVGIAGGESYENVYSPEEQRIGTWVESDGSKKPLYRKCYTATVDVSTGNFVIDPELPPGLDFVANMGGTLLLTNGNTLGIPYMLSTSMHIVIVANITSGFILTIYGNSSSLIGSVVRAYIEYTKSTDQPEVSV